MPDAIRLRGLRVMALCGALPEEHDRPQPFELDVDIHLDLSVAGNSDDLGDTVDYGELVARIEALCTAEHEVLLERMAERVAQMVLTDELVQSVEVEVRKLRPPVPQQLETTGVRILRVRT
jgi:dihydroneopterin aldolase